MQNTLVQYRYLDSPIGQLLLAGRNDILWSLGFAGITPQADWQHDPNVFQECAQQLQEYFAGQRRKFEIKYSLQGTTFQRKVLGCVAKVPYALTASYSQIAQEINHPKASRAVGRANATNPLSIIIPCHRVIGKCGRLTGFAGGLEVKSYLLALEKRA